MAPAATALADGGNTSGGGLSDSTKSVIGGVVGGVGGAIVLAVLFAVIWRLRQRRRNREMENDDVLMMNEKDSSSSTPFKSTLESYHAQHDVNASSNF